MKESQRYSVKVYVMKKLIFGIIIQIKKLRRKIMKLTSKEAKEIVESYREKTVTDKLQYLPNSFIFE